MMSEPTLYQFDQELADIIWQQERTDYLPLLARALKEGVLVPFEPDIDEMANRIVDWTYELEGETPADDLARQVWALGIGAGT